MAINLVADDRVAEVGGVNPQLVGAPRDRLKLDERRVIQSLAHGEVRDRRLAAIAHPPVRLTRRVTINRRLPLPRVFGDTTGDERQVTLPDQAAAEVARQQAQRALGLGDNHHTRRGAVEAMNQAGPRQPVRFAVRRRDE